MENIAPAPARRNGPHIWPAAMLLVLLPAFLLPRAAQAADTVRLRVMTLNIFYGGDGWNLADGGFCRRPQGCQAQFARIVQTVRASGADIVGIEEGEHNTRRLAEALGFHFNERTQTISRYPLIDPPGADGNYVFADLGGSRVVAIANMHLPSDPYGPYAVRDGASLEEVLALENSVRLPKVVPRLPALQALAAQRIPVFVTGDFNSPSHLDWTPAVAQVRPDVRYPVPWPVSIALAEAGFLDSYRQAWPDPVSRPGFTWTPGGPEADPNDVFDRIDGVLAAGPATLVASQIVGEQGNPEVDIAMPVFPTDHRGVVSTYDVLPAQPGALAAVALRRLFVGDELSVTVIAPPGSVVEIVPTSAGPLPVTARAQQCRADCKRTLRFATDDLAPGAYEAVLRGPAGNVLTRSPFWLYAAATPPGVTVLRPRLQRGEPIDVRVSAAPGMRWDWVAVYKAVGGSRSRFAATCNATPCGSGNYLVGEHTSAIVEGTVRISGVWPYDIPGAWPLAVGRYEVRLLLDDGYRQLAVSAPFEVIEPALGK